MKLLLASLLIFPSFAIADEKTDLCIMQVKTYSKIRAKYVAGGEDKFLILAGVLAGSASGYAASNAAHIAVSIPQYMKAEGAITALKEKIIQDFIDFRKAELSKFQERRRRSTRSFFDSADETEKRKIVDEYRKEMTEIKKKYQTENKFFTEEARKKYSDLESLINKFDTRIFKDPEAVKDLLVTIHQTAKDLTKKFDKIRSQRVGVSRAGAVAGGAAGGLIAGVAVTGAQLSIIQKNCGEKISDAGAATLAPFVDASLLGGCSLTPKGAKALAAMPDEELQKSCEKFPALGDIINALHITWMQSLAKIQLPDMDVSCKDGAVESLSLTPGDRDRTYTATFSRSSMKVNASAAKTEPEFKYEVPYDEESGKFGTVQSEGIFSSSQEGLHGLDAKDFIQFRENHKKIPTDLFQRKHYDIGDSLNYFDGMVPIAKKVCAAKSGPEKVNVLSGTDGKK